MNPNETADQSDQQITALLLPHLPDDELGRARAHRLLDQAAERDLTGAFEIRLPGLHRDHVGQR